MLFNTLQFMLLAACALSLTLFVRRAGPAAPKFCLIAASVGFYGLWNPHDIPVLLLSLAGNYWLAGVLCGAAKEQRRSWLAIGVVANLLLLAWFKVGHTWGGYLALVWPQFPVPAERALPLGISFFTFQQIAYLVSLGKSGERIRLPDYTFVICFFPHLVAGPLVRHRDMLRQLGRPSTFALRASNLFAGISLFIIGLAKKVLIADPLGLYSTVLFRASDAGQSLDLLSAWIAAVAGFLNFYFDFSGYSDMACGLALVVGIRLPLNFYSPFKSVSMDEFWNRWNITVTQFIREHVFRPLAGRRLVIRRHLAALPITMILAGMWHGASLTFLAWGALHGVIVTAQHARRLVWRKRATRNLGRARQCLGWAQTQLLLIVLGCFFMSHNLGGAWRMLEGMAGASEAAALPMLPSLLPAPMTLAVGMLAGMWGGEWVTAWIGTVEALLFIALAWGISACAPNSIQLLGRYRPVQDSTNLLHAGLIPRLPGVQWFGRQVVVPGPFWTLALGAVFALCLLRILSNAASPFNYYNY
ncbi:MBOAT family O-acyltransferase [Pseudomonas pseudonitroreducens]|uniref:MBOAT family O-acyltransferase n=1 Tax=Pseudomonas pseudonitroreducens TaxID=2892326 RepID=UPI001F2CBEB0|nr:MBOAT family O-acyltransferase [Pseudomonas pseudonitroreducens]